MAGVRVLAADGTAAVGRLPHDFDTEYDVITPGPPGLAIRLSEVIGSGETDVLVIDEGC